jgi:hypothetical protein
LDSRSYGVVSEFVLLIAKIPLSSPRKQACHIGCLEEIGRPNQGCHADNNGRTDGRTMAAGSSVT